MKKKCKEINDIITK